MAYVTNKMKEAGLMKNQNQASKYLVLAGINIVNCINSAQII